MKNDDHTISDRQLVKIRRRANLLLARADALGSLPTPVDELIAAADLEIARDVSLDKTFLGRLYKRFVPEEMKRAVEKVLGVMDSRARVIYLDQTVHKNKKPFLSLHEVGHDYLPWQRDTFAILEDSESSLDPDVREQFEREANCFASEVIFQLDRFTNEAADCEFGIKVPINLARRYGASVYSSIRRYVMTHHHPCAVIVFNRVKDGGAEALTLRRCIQSDKFTQTFGNLSVKVQQGPDDFFAQHVPRNKFRMPTSCALNNRNGQQEECLVEAFDSSFQVFFLLYPVANLSRRIAV